MAVAVAHTLAVGERLPSVRFLLPISGRSSVQSVEISAEIVWLSESKRGAGIRFIGLSADAPNHIANWIASERTAPELEHLPKPVFRDKRPLEISSGKSRTIFSSPPIRDGEAVARYARMFPSENSYPKITATLEEIQPEKEPPSSTTSRGHRAADITTPGLPAEVPMGGIAQTQSSVFSPERNGKSATEPIETSAGDEGKHPTPGKPETQASDNKIELWTVLHDASSNFELPEKSALPEKSTEKGFKLQFAIFGFVLVAISFILGLTAGYGPIEKRLRNIHKPAPRLVAISPAPIVPSEPPTSEPGAKLEASPAEASPPDREVSLPENRPAPLHSGSSNPATRATPIEPSLPQRRIKNGSDSSLKTHKLDTAHPAEAKPQKMPTSSESPATAPSKNSNPSAALESKESKSSMQPENQPEERNDSNSSAESSASPASPKLEPASPPPPAVSTPDAPRDSAESSANPLSSPTPTPNPAPPHAPVPTPASVAIPPAENGKLVRAVFPRKSISASPSPAITSQLSVLISPAERSTVGDRETARLQAGEIISYVVPRQPRPGDQYNSIETVRVRATISTDGRVTDVKPINGPIFLLSSVISAVHQWRFHPTLLNGAPVKAEDDVTIEFRLKR
jgi:protein TonB